MKFFREIHKNFESMSGYSKGLVNVSVVLALAVALFALAVSFSGIAGVDTLVIEAAGEAPKILVCGIVLALFCDIVAKNS